MSVDVSVLTPVLNEEEHIREAAAKMLSQRFNGTIEFIFIDGASEDRTVEILRELARSDSRVRILDNPRRSTPSSLNIGLAAFNILPIPPLDGYNFWLGVLPPSLARLLYPLNQYGFMLLILLVMLPSFGGPDLLSALIGPVLSLFSRLVTGGFL